jgi:hypothetical protein
MSEVERHSRDSVPTAAGALAFRAKSAGLQLRRRALNLLVRRQARHRRGETLDGARVIAESRSKLWAEGSAAERALQAGKVHNLRLAVRRLDGVEVPAGAVFSFWTHVGRASRRKGFARGRELREGCVIATVGGGLCQLSNALYDAALQADFEIVERHAHTRVVPGSHAEAGRDATVFWNYVDLRWRAPQAFRIEASLDRDQLVVRFRADAVRREKTRTLHALQTNALTNSTPRADGDCTTCGVLECFRHVGSGVGDGKANGLSVGVIESAAGDLADGAGNGLAAGAIRGVVDSAEARFGRTAFLVDGFWPEFDEYIRAERSREDAIFLPLDGKRFGRANYAWDTRGFGEVRERRLATLWRSLASRRLASQGARRQMSLLRHAEKLAEGYARALAFDVTRVVVMQHLLPFLWRGGHLGGRSFDVLMCGLPLARLHETLDRAAALHPESPTLADFRADGRLVRDETEALAAARRVITPHALVASLFGERAALLDWHLPRAVREGSRGADVRGGESGARAFGRGTRVVFPGPTVGRKGAYEVREAARRLELSIVVAGGQPEGEGFWNGVAVERREWKECLRDAGVVVMPAFVEHRPRRLLEAVARGVPVVASAACGLGETAGVVNVRAGDVDALCGGIEKALAFETATDVVTRSAASPVV